MRGRHAVISRVRADELNECDPRGELERHGEAVIATANVESAPLGR